MKKVGSREFKNRQGYYLRRVRKGETIIVTDRGKPVAMVEPIRNESGPGDDLEKRLQELAAQGHIRLATRPLAPFKALSQRGKPASQMITEDRG